MRIDPGDPRTWPASALDLIRRRERATLGNAELAEIIRARIRRDGPIPFADFMRLALTHPEHGYYTTAPAPFSRGGDFLTSPETHPAFGALVCRWLARLWAEMGSPARFDVVEAGAGSGALAAQILDATRARFPDLHAALTYTIVEPGAPLRVRQQDRLRGAPRMRWASGLEEIGTASVRGCILSNELLDALPVHRVQATREGLREIYVGLRDAELVDVLGPLSTPAIEAHLDWVGAAPPEGAQGEVGLEAAAWYRRAAGCLAEGALFTIDYGHSTAELYSSQRPRGTLLCYYRHTASEDPYRRIGTQDITAHVDFTALQKAGQEEGLRTCLYTTQAEWLRSLGIGESLARGGECEVEGDWGRLPASGSLDGDAPRGRRDLLALVDPNGLGRLRVLVQWRPDGSGSMGQRVNGSLGERFAIDPLPH